MPPKVKGRGQSSEKSTTENPISQPLVRVSHSNLLKCNCKQTYKVSKPIDTTAVLQSRTGLRFYATNEFKNDSDPEFCMKDEQNT